MEKSITGAQASAAIIDFVGRMKTRGGEADCSLLDHIAITFTQGVWGDVAKVRCERRYNGPYSVSVSWSSITRSLAQAAAAVANYRDAIEVAAILQAFVERLPSIKG